ncbi:MAG: hypothetical protein AABX47_10640 [Nanoarchaeota archaeon]
MAKIPDLDGFTAELERCLSDPTSFNRNRMNSYLCNLKLRLDDRHGLCFDYTIELAMKLFDRAFHNLHDGTTAAGFARKIAGSMADFGDRFNESLVSCYPHFLLHGISADRLDPTLEKIQDNSRIIHETLIERAGFVARHGRSILGNDLESAYCVSDVSDHCFGVTSLLVTNCRPYGTYYGYVAKFGIFLDKTNREAIGLGVQGQKPTKPGDGEYFARLSHLLRMDPRAYLIQDVMDTLSDEGYARLKVLVPSENPMTLENHSGFLGRYEPALREAGLTNRTGIYLTATLRS